MYPSIYFTIKHKRAISEELNKSSNPLVPSSDVVLQIKVFKHERDKEALPINIPLFRQFCRLSICLPNITLRRRHCLPMPHYDSRLRFLIKSNINVIWQEQFWTLLLWIQLYGIHFQNASFNPEVQLLAVCSKLIVVLSMHCGHVRCPATRWIDVNPCLLFSEFALSDSKKTK